MKQTKFFSRCLAVILSIIGFSYHQVDAAPPTAQTAAAKAARKAAKKRAKAARKAGTLKTKPQQQKAPVKPLKPQPLTKKQAKQIRNEILKMGKQLDKLSAGPATSAAMKELGILAKIGMGVPEISKIEINEKKRPLADLVKTLQGGFLFTPSYNAASEIKTIPEKITAFQNIVTEFDADETSLGNVKKLLSEISKINDKVTAESLEDYKALLTSVETKYGKFGTTSGIKNLLLRKAYKKFKAIHDRVTGEAFFDKKALKDAIKKRTPVATRITALKNIVDTFAPLAGDSTSLGNLKSLLNAINKTNKKVVTVSLEDYKTLLVAAETKYSQFGATSGIKFLTLRKAYKAFKLVHDRITGGAFLDKQALRDAIKKRTPVATRITALKNLVEKFTPLEKDSVSLGNLKSLLNAINKTNKKVTTESVASYKTLLTAAKTKYSQFGTTSGIKFLLLRKSYTTFSGIHDRVLGGAFPNMSGALKAAKKQKPLTARMRALQNISAKFVLIANDKQTRSDAIKLAKGITAIYSKITPKEVIKYKALLMATDRKISTDPKVTKQRSYKKFKKIYDEVISGAFSFVVKLNAVKKQKTGLSLGVPKVSDLNTAIQLLEEIVRGAPAKFLKKKGKTLKNKMVNVGKSVRKLIRKKWNDRMVDRYTKLANNVKGKIPKYRKKLDTRIAKLYDQELSNNNKAVKKINKAKKKITKLGVKYQKAQATVAQLGAVKLKVYQVAKKLKLSNAKKTVRKHQSNVAKQNKIISQQNAKLRQAQQRLSKAPTSVKGKMKPLTP